MEDNPLWDFNIKINNIPNVTPKVIEIMDDYLWRSSSLKESNENQFDWIDSPFGIDDAVLSYLEYQGQKSYDINLDVIIQTETGDENVVSQSNFKYMYWNMAQQLAHHTVNGCNIRCGDLMGSGTISGPTEDSYGSMLEIAWKGTKPLKMKYGSERKIILDHDTVVMKGYSEKNGIRIGFGEVSTKVLPAK